MGYYIVRCNRFVIGLIDSLVTLAREGIPIGKAEGEKKNVLLGESGSPRGRPPAALCRRRRRPGRQPSRGHDAVVAQPDAATATTA